MPVALLDTTPPKTALPPLLEARALRFTRNDEPVFGPLDFVVEANEALLVQGDNGAGKTTLLRVLAGLLKVDEGEILIEGRTADAYQRSHAIAYLGHLPALKADLSALENLDFLCGLHGRRTRSTGKASGAKRAGWWRMSIPACSTCWGANSARPACWRGRSANRCGCGC